jgi:cytochrome c556
MFSPHRYPSIVVVVLIALVTTAGAHEGATGVAKDRMDLMGDISQRLKSIAKRLNANRDLPAIAADADHIAEIAPRIPDLFPAGSDKGITDAKPAIWQHWDEFVGDQKKLIEETRKLSSMAASGDARAIADQYRTVAKSCIACHDTFRRGRADRL